MTKRLGKQTIEFKSDVSILATANVAGKKEGEGPFKKYFDVIMENAEWGEKTWEKTESKMQKDVVTRAMEKAGLNKSDIDCIFAGDLLDQCIGTSFAMRDLSMPFYGLYGACSTMAEGISLAAMLIDGEFASNTVAVTSSHFCTAERQYRFPLEYGGQRTPTAQWTVTAAGATVLSSSGSGPYVTHATTGKIIDLGIKDANNMGAAMAPAAVETIKAHFKDTGKKPNDYDLILTGDLGTVGKQITIEMLAKEGLDISNNYDDCGCMIFDIKKQDMHAGGSGCGCGAAILNGYIMTQLKKNELNNVLFLGTGALLSPTSSMQGESIPCIAHAVAISNKK